MSKIKTRIQLIKIKGGAVVYNWLRKNNPKLLDIHLPNTHLKWNLETVKAEALKYETRKEWQVNAANSYMWAHKNQKLEECCAHMKQGKKTNGYWTFENCKADALKYKTRSEWQRASGSGYPAASDKGWVEECCAHMEEGIKPKGYWTFENCKADALKYKTRSEWQRASGSVYMAAHINGWLEDCCAHMPKNKLLVKVKNLDTGEVYNSVSEAGRAIGQQSGANISRAIKNGTKCGGYHWAYCDEKGNIIK